MTRRITGDDLRAYAAANFPEPYQPRLGSYGHWDAMAAILTHIAEQDTRWEEVERGQREGRREDRPDIIRHRRLGLKMALGEILAIRIQEDPMPGYTGYDVTTANAISRADEYTKWAKELLERET